MYLAILAVCSFLPPANPQPRAKPVSAPLVYEGTMLVLVTDEGAAAVVFRPLGDGSVVYDFRYESKNATKTEQGTKTLKEPEKIPGKSYADPTIEAGPIKLVWSQGGPGNGWIYYFPETMRVYPAMAKDFSDRLTNRPKLDLQRFLK